MKRIQLRQRSHWITYQTRAQHLFTHIENCVLGINQHYTTLRDVIKPCVFSYCVIDLCAVSRTWPEVCGLHIMRIHIPQYPQLSWMLKLRIIRGCNTAPYPYFVTFNQPEWLKYIIAISISLLSVSVALLPSLLPVAAYCLINYLFCHHVYSMLLTGRHWWELSSAVHNTFSTICWITVYSV